MAKDKDKDNNDTTKNNGIPPAPTATVVEEQPTRVIYDQITVVEGAQGQSMLINNQLVCGPSPENNSPVIANWSVDAGSVQKYLRDPRGVQEKK